MAVVYRSVRDLYNYHTSTAYYEGRLTTRDIRKTISWILSDSTHEVSFLYYIDCGSNSLEDMYYLISKIRNYALEVKKYIDAN